MAVRFPVRPSLGQWLYSRGTLERHQELGMCILTFRTVWTETGHIEFAQRLSDMLLLAVGAQRTVAQSKPFANTTSLRRIDVYVQTFLSILTPSVLREELTLWHPPQIVLVQELTCV